MRGQVDIQARGVTRFAPCTLYNTRYIQAAEKWTYLRSNEI
jgi:hypothetical protein